MGDFKVQREGLLVAAPGLDLCSLRRKLTIRSVWTLSWTRPREQVKGRMTMVVIGGGRTGGGTIAREERTTTKRLRSWSYYHQIKLQEFFIIIQYVITYLRVESMLDIRTESVTE